MVKIRIAAVIVASFLFLFVSFSQSHIWITESAVKISGQVAEKYIHESLIRHYDLGVSSGKQNLIIGHVSNRVHQETAVGQPIDFCLMRQKNFNGGVRFFADLDCKSFRRFI